MEIFLASVRAYRVRDEKNKSGEWPNARSSFFIQNGINLGGHFTKYIFIYSDSLRSKEYKNPSLIEPHPLGEELAWAWI